MEEEKPLIRVDHAPWLIIVGNDRSPLMVKKWSLMIVKGSSLSLMVSAR